MNNLQIVRMADLVETSWKNGGGITRNIAIQEDTGGLLWRLSMADVSRDGPFSAFEGLTRILTVIAGEGLVLDSPERTWQISYAAPVTFDGGLSVTGRLTAGPVRDFNLMFDTARITGTARVMYGPAVLVAGAPEQTTVCHVITGRVELTGQATDLHPGDTAILANCALPLTLGGETLALLIELAPRR